MDSDDDSASLCEDDVPGASLDGRDVGALKIPELKRWLQCRRASTKGLKADLIARYYYRVRPVPCGNIYNHCN